MTSATDLNGMSWDDQSDDIISRLTHLVEETTRLDLDYYLDDIAEDIVEEIVSRPKLLEMILTEATKRAAELSIAQWPLTTDQAESYHELRFVVDGDCEIVRCWRDWGYGGWDDMDDSRQISINDISDPGPILRKLRAKQDAEDLAKAVAAKKAERLAQERAAQEAIENEAHERAELKRLTEKYGVDGIGSGKLKE